MDQWISEDNQIDEVIFLDLHSGWEDACVRAADVAPTNGRELLAKARILLAFLNVVAPSERDRKPHEQLAASLARDLLAWERTEPRC